MYPDDIEKTAISTPFGLFEYVYMPYGLRNSSASFQRFMDNIFRNHPNVFSYIDDVLVTSESEEDHLKHLDSVFKILHENNLKIALDKCEFLKTSINFLGFQLSKDGISPPSIKIEAIQNFSPPRTTKELRRFLGMINFYSHLIKDLAEILTPLSDLMKDTEGKNVEIQWSQVQNMAFEKAKMALQTAAPLHFPSPNATDLQLVTDASKVAIGAVLHHHFSGAQ